MIKYYHIAVSSLNNKVTAEQDIKESSKNYLLFMTCPLVA